MANNHQIDTIKAGNEFAVSFDMSVVKRLNIKWDPEFTQKLKATCVLYDVTVTDFFRLMTEALVNGNDSIVSIVKKYGIEKRDARLKRIEQKRLEHFNKGKRGSSKMLKINGEMVKVDTNSLSKDDIFKMIEDEGEKNAQNS